MGGKQRRKKHGSNLLLELQAEVLPRVRAETASALSKPDPLGAILAPIADLTVDLRLVSCHCGAVQSLPAGHCRRKKESGLGLTSCRLCLLHLMLCSEPQAKNTAVIPGTGRAPLPRAS